MGLIKDCQRKAIEVYSLIAMSLATVWGVEKMSVFSMYNFFLSSGLTSPVNISIGRSIYFLNVLKSWATSGFDGAKIRIFESLKFFSLSPASIIAIAVFPRPVGRTTSVFLVRAV